jgi:predicted MPP superfamily phosphohydrolase
MRLQLISDLHTEFLTGRELSVIQSLPIEKNLDFLVVAGDTVVPGYQGSFIIEQIFGSLSEMARHVLVVWGNHEYYGGSKAWTEHQLNLAIARYPSIHRLDISQITLDGVHFFGGVMWYPWLRDGLNKLFAPEISDIHQIQNFDWAEMENAAFNAAAAHFIKPETVVVTHHLPHPSCIASIFEGSHLNRFFMSDESHILTLKQPRLWLCGHSHAPCDVLVGSTRIVANPYGYPSERAGRPYLPVVFDV